MKVDKIQENKDNYALRKVDEEMELISIIVPVYKVEKYLDRCVLSLINQTYSNIEIILVDDGSPDNCPGLCDKYASQYENIKAVHKSNGGLSSARNAGLDAAKGTYIGFVDSDDWVTQDAYEYMLRHMKKYEADVMQCNFVKTDKEKGIRNETEILKVYEGKDVCEFYMEFSTITGSYSVWTCLYSRKIVENLRFREGKINEDIDFKYKAMAKCKRLIVSNQIKYFYFQSGDSLSTGGLKQKDFDLYDAANELYELTKNESYGKIRYLAKVKKSRTAFSLLSKIAYYGIADNLIDEKATVNELLEENRKNCRVLLESPMSFSRKVLCVMYCINFTFAKKVVHIARKLKII